MSHPKVSIIILNWNQPDFTVNCVKSVLKQTYTDSEILVVDNGSRDNSLEIFRKEFSENKKIRILGTKKNFGYAGGNNFGVKHARGRYVVILNNDTIVEKEWLNELVTGIESNENIGSVSSLEIREGRKSERDYRKTGITVSLLGYYVLYKRTKALKGGLVDFFGVKGVSFIYRKNLVKLPFDPDYFIYAEDLYLGWLLRLKGYENKLAHPNKRQVHHYHNITKKRNKSINNYFVFLGERNRIMNLLLFYEPKNLIKILPLLFAGIILINLYESRKIVSRIKSYLWILFNLKKIMTKRRLIQGERKILDSEILKEMSSKFYEEDRITNKLIKNFLETVNQLFYGYCRIVGLKTIEVT